MNHLIDWIIFLPAIVACVILIVPRSLQGWARPLALLASSLVAVLALVAFSRFDTGAASLGLSHQSKWLPLMGASYSVAFDGLNLPLVLLTTILTPLVLLGTWSFIDGSGARQTSMMAMVLLMETGALGTFLSQDLLLFYVFWEIILVPAYLLVGMYGGEGRARATLQFFLYTFAGSLLMLLGIAWLIYQQQSGGVPSAAIADLQKLKIPFDASAAGGLFSPQGLLFLAFAAAFFVKSPLVPLHGWLPSTYTQAPPLVTIYLAAILSKMGTYGILKILLPLFPDAIQAFSGVLMWMAAIGIVYGALLALTQTNLKTAIAYSSLSHVSYILLGLFSLEGAGISGALMQMVNHGIVIAGLFLTAAWLEQRRGSQELKAFGGWARSAPFLAVFFMIFTLSSVALPGTNGFVGEFMVLMASFKVQAGSAVLATTGMVLGAMYMLNIYQKTMFGSSADRETGEISGGKSRSLDLGFGEAVVATVLSAFIIGLGVWPQTMLKSSSLAVEAVVKSFTKEARLERSEPASALVREAAKR